MKRDDIHLEDSIFDDWTGASRLEMPLSRIPFFLVGGCAGLLIAVFLIRVAYLDAFQVAFYGLRAAANVDKELVIPAYRGVITDRFGVPLVSNIPSFRVSIDIAELYRAHAADPAAMLLKVADILGMDPEAVRSLVRGADLESAVRVTVARDVPAEQVIDMRALGSDAVVIEDDYRREYPDAAVFAPIIGYTKGVDFKSVREGAAGLEASYDAALRGTDGARVTYRDAKGNVLQEKRLREAQAGLPLKTTIDGEFQKYFYARFKEGLASLGKTSGVGMAMNPKTGEVLALVSLPSFDNNDPAAYLSDPQKPLFNRAISGVYSPGSTIKPLVALAALHEHLIDPEFSVYSPGYLELPNPYDPEHPNRFLDWRPQGRVNLYSALARSSNVFFYVVGGGCTASTCNDVGRSRGLGITKLNQYWREFGMNAKTGVDIPAESVGFLPAPEEKEARTHRPWSIGDTYNVSIGQGDLGVTPIRLLSFFSSIANGGVGMKPHFLFGAAPEMFHDFSSWKDELVAVRQGLRDVVGKPYGTASALYDLSYKTSGKTGSAQIQNNAKTNAFFMGYGPSDDPQLAVLVLVEDAKTGSLNAVPIGHDVMKWYYDHRM